MECICHLRQQQLESFEEMNKLEIRILCRILPKPINELDHLIPSNHLTLGQTNPANDNSLDETTKKRQKSIQDCKRQMLAKNLEEYETAIEQNECLYQEELFNFESALSTEEHDQTKNNLMTYLRSYLDTQTRNKIRSIRYNETIFRRRLLHPRHRQSATILIPSVFIQKQLLKYSIKYLPRKN